MKYCVPPKDGGVSKKMECVTQQNHHNLLDIAKNVLVKVEEFIFPIDFVILDMEEDGKGPK
ncbi:hypothetical protein CR513_31110, partial [Mucuna pruriens]